MPPEFWFSLVKEHFGSILVFLLVVLAWWRGGFSQLSNIVASLEAGYDWARKEAQQREIYRIAQTAFAFANDEAAMLVKKTDTTMDDALLDKGKFALEWALKAMKKAGLDPSDPEAKDVLKGYFGEFHDAERKAKALAAGLPGAPLLPAPPAGNSSSG